MQAPEKYPHMRDAAFLEMTAKEKASLRKPPTEGQLEDLFPRTSFRYFIARMKEMANRYVSHFVSGVGIPEGLREASVREAYYAGLVTGMRLSLNLRRDMWEEMVLREEEEVVQDDIPKAAEPDPFTGAPITRMSQPGD